MVVTAFRSRLRSESADEYRRWAVRMDEQARAMPGHVSHKVFIAEDGERVTVVEFESEEAQRAWAVHAGHVDAKQKGRADLYEEYRIQVCTVVRESAFKRKS